MGKNKKKHSDKNRISAAGEQNRENNGEDRDAWATQDVLDREKLFHSTFDDDISDNNRIDADGDKKEENKNLKETVNETEAAQISLGNTEDKSLPKENSENIGLLSAESKGDHHNLEGASLSSESNSSIGDGKKKKKRSKKDPFDIKKDIWYRGPLSYRHLKILGWICLIISQIAFVLSIGDKMGMGIDVGILSNTAVTDKISSLSLPLLLVSLFAVLLSKRDSYKESLILYGVLALGIAGLFLLFYYHYILGMAQPISSYQLPLSIEMPSKEYAEGFLTSVLYKMEDFKGFLDFNIFIDVFLCTLVMFFLDYTPKRLFQGKKIVFFRALVAFPVLYEVACIFIKIMTINHLMEIPLWISPFLTTKPPVSMIMFLSIVRYMKMQEKKYLDTGRTIEEYREYCKTNIHSFRFSKHLIVIILVYALIDLGLLIVLTAFHIVMMDGIMDPAVLATEEGMNLMIRAVNKVNEWGIGGTAYMIVLSPIVLLFSYTRTHKVKVIDRLIPIIGLVLIGLVYFEGVFQLVQSWVDYALYEIRLGVENNADSINAFYYKIEEFVNQYGNYMH